MGGRRALAIAAAIWTGVVAMTSTGVVAETAAGAGTAMRGVGVAGPGASAAAGGEVTVVQEPAGAVATRSPRDPCVADPPAVIRRQPAPESSTGELPAELRSTLDKLARESVKLAATPGAIVGVRTPQGTWTSAYGLADPTAELPMTTDMHMRIGSITKSFTGTVILQLEQEGALSLSDPIDKYYKGIPNGDRITLRHLTNMTSGIAAYYTNAFLNRFFADPSKPIGPDELIAYGVSVSPVFDPGGMFHYSNTNAILLGKVIEAVTGQSVDTVFQQRIYGPLGLTRTSLPSASPGIPAPHPQGFTLQGTTTPGRQVNATGWSPSIAWTAGGMISTVGDMLTYTRALGTGQGLLSPAVQAMRLASIPPSAAYGLALACQDGWVGHSGRLPGFDTAAYYDTKADTTIVVMANSDISSGKCGESPTLIDNPTNLPCASPARRVIAAVSQALGRKYDPPPSQ